MTLFGAVTIPTVAPGDTTTVPTNLAVYRDALKAATEAWTAYTPTWTASVNPAINNGTLTGKYLRLNKWIRGRIQLTVGSTTTFGTGNWSFALPVAAHADYTANMCLGQGLALDLSAVAYSDINAGWVTSSAIFVLASNTVGGALVAVGPTTPWTWAVGDKLSIDFDYEAA